MVPKYTQGCWLSEEWCGFYLPGVAILLKGQIGVQLMCWVNV